MDSNQLIGIGLRHPHYLQILLDKPNIAWLEVHSENFFHAGGPALDTLLKIREHYPISLHGIGLSLGSITPPDKDHLNRLKNLIEYIDPFLISEHLSWSKIAGIYIPDLLPIPYNLESLNIFCDNINIAQDFLGRELLIENPSSYLEYKSSDYIEVDFLVEICRKTGAKILLDINNIFVSCENHNWDASAYINAIPQDLIKEVHLAGHSIKDIADKIIRVDTHDTMVCSEVWQLYAKAIAKFGPTLTLLEWDANIPSLDILIKEANKALPILEKRYA